LRPAVIQIDNRHWPEIAPHLDIPQFSKQTAIIAIVFRQMQASVG
jgi:hypothetical protein